jgi:hypothetical protein
MKSWYIVTKTPPKHQYGFQDNKRERANTIVTLFVYFITCSLWWGKPACNSKAATICLKPMSGVGTQNNALWDGLCSVEFVKFVIHFCYGLIQQHSVSSMCYRGNPCVHCPTQILVSVWSYCIMTCLFRDKKGTQNGLHRGKDTLPLSTFNVRKANRQET